MTVQVFGIRLAIAIALGMVIGLERQLHHRMAGTRTNALVATGAAIFTIIGGLFVGDPSSQPRVVSYIVSGIGFLGAGVIFKEGANIQGLNTAATIWCAAAVGTLAGLGYAVYALFATIAILLINMTLRPLTYKLRPELKPTETPYQVELFCSNKNESYVRSLLVNDVDRKHLILKAVTKEQAPDAQVRLAIDLTSSGRNDETIEQLVARLSLENTVTAVRWSSTASPSTPAAARRTATGN